LRAEQQAHRRGRRPIHERKSGPSARRDRKLQRAGFRIVRVAAQLVLSKPGKLAPALSDLAATAAPVRAALSRESMANSTRWSQSAPPRCTPAGGCGVRARAAPLSSGRLTTHNDYLRQPHPFGYREARHAAEGEHALTPRGSSAARSTRVRGARRLRFLTYVRLASGLGCPHRPVLALRAARFLPPPYSVLAAEAAAARGMEGGRRDSQSRVRIRTPLFRTRGTSAKRRSIECQHEREQVGIDSIGGSRRYRPQ